MRNMLAGPLVVWAGLFAGGCSAPLNPSACANQPQDFCGPGMWCQQGPDWSRCVAREDGGGADSGGAGDAGAGGAGAGGSDAGGREEVHTGADGPQVVVYA